ncbi:hypothetical protein FJV41_49355, partial [Myxococcus llanfairpwllgwyngyllgogerychwyrndrobwllllantysiliogogogochensis]
MTAWAPPRSWRPSSRRCSARRRQRRTRAMPMPCAPRRPRRRSWRPSSRPSSRPTRRPRRSPRPRPLRRSLLPGRPSPRRRLPPLLRTVGVVGESG